MVVSYLRTEGSLLLKERARPFQICATALIIHGPRHIYAPTLMLFPKTWNRLQGAMTMDKERALHPAGAGTSPTQPPLLKMFLHRGGRTEEGFRVTSGIALLGPNPNVTICHWGDSLPCQTFISSPGTRTLAEGISCLVAPAQLRV